MYQIYPQFPMKIYFLVKWGSTDTNETPFNPLHKNTPLYDKSYKTHMVSMAQLDARPTGDQEVAGSTPPRSATFIRGD